MSTNLNRKRFFTNVELIGNDIIERFIDTDGKEKIRTVKYEPTLFLKTPAKTNYKDIYGNYCVPKRFDNIFEARNWSRMTKNSGEEVLGMDNFILSYLSDAYPDDIEYDINKIRVAIFDIEVTTDGPFPEVNEAEYPIDAISIYDTLDNKIYVYDLIEDVEHGIKPVRPWRPDRNDLSDEVLAKVVYRTFTNSDDLLLAFIDYLRMNQPSILAGWNSDKFDIPYIVNRLKRQFGKDFAKHLSPYNELVERTSYDGLGKPYTSYSPKGMAHMDYMDIYQAFRFKTQPSLSLDYIGKEETGQGKIDYIGPIHTLRRGNYLPTFKPDYDENDKLGKWLYIKYMIQNFYETKRFKVSVLDQLTNVISKDGIEEYPDKIIRIMDAIEANNEDIERLDDLDKLKNIRDIIYQIYSDESHRKFITYSIMDVQLVKDIDNNLSFLELVFDIAYYAKMPIDSVMSKIQIWDAIIFNSLKKSNIVVPMKDIPEHNERIVGAFVKDPIVGIHKRVLSFDLTSLEIWGIR